MDDFENPIFTSPIEGSIENPNQSQLTTSNEPSTLDEPVRVTIVSLVC